MNIYSNENINRDSWDAIIRKSPYASPFQTPQFYDFINSIDGHSAEVFALSHSLEYSALIVITIQKKSGLASAFSKRGISYGGPILSSNSIDRYDLFLSYLNSYYRHKLIYLEIRNLFDYSKLKNCYEKNNWSYVAHSNFKLKLSNKTLKDVISGMTYNRRREIKQSLKQGTIYYECKNESELLKVYNILSDLYKKRVKLPLPSFEYFSGLLKSKISPIFIVKHNGNIIGGSICPVIQDKGIFTFYYCGIREYHPKIFPTHIAILAAIDFALNNNLSYLDFMGAGKPLKEYGVRKYKSQFGGEYVEDGRYINVFKPILYRIGRFAIQLLSKI